MGARKPKRDMGNITVIEHRDGGQSYRVQLRAHGQKLSRNFDDVDKAREWRDEKKRRRRQGVAIDDPVEPMPEMSVNVFVAEVWWPVGMRNKAAKTERNYLSAYRNWIADSELGAMPVAEVSSEDVLMWMDEAEAEGAGPDTIRSALKPLSAAMSWGAERPRTTGIKGNPVLRWPRVTRKHQPVIVEPLWVERVRQLILQGHRKKGGERNALLLSLMHMTGVRPSEARGLRLRDFDFSAGEILLPQEVSKTGSARVLPLWAPLAADVKSWRELAGLKRSDFVVGKIDGSQMSLTGWENWRDRIYEPARDEVAEIDGAPAQLELARPYDLCRHSFAALQIRALVPASEIARIMGHSEETLWRHYTPKLEARPNEPIDPESAVIEARELVAAQVRSRS